MENYLQALLAGLDGSNIASNATADNHEILFLYSQ